jgi:hypothetical protein
MTQKYKLEKWKRVNWAGTKRAETITVEKLVMRDANGHFAKNKPVIDKIQTKFYGSGVYKVGIVGNKIIVRQKIAGRNIEWFEKRKEIMTNTELFRTSYVLNNVPISKTGYFGFRIVAFYDDEQTLKDLKPKLKERLIEWIEDCINYEEDEFWFDMYFGYEAPSKTNANKSEKGKYYLTKENDKGMILKEDKGRFYGL